MQPTAHIAAASLNELTKPANYRSYLLRSTDAKPQDLRVLLHNLSIVLGSLYNHF